MCVVIYYRSAHLPFGETQFRGSNGAYCRCLLCLMAELLVLLRRTPKGNGNGVLGGLICRAIRPDASLPAVHGMEGYTCVIDSSGNLYVPNAAFVVKGEIIGNDWETSKDTLDAETPEEYWTEERVTAWKEKVGALLEQVKAAE